MKQMLFIFLLFFSLIIGVSIIIDLLQGLSMYETLYSFIKIKVKMTGEEVVLIIFFLLPLIFTKANSFINQKKNKNV